MLVDPQGAAFCAWEPKDRKGAQLVNEPGAWSMSALNARDPDGSEAFYGEVFGWTTQAFPVGDMEATLWRLPGYVGGEPEQPVPRDNVATMAPMTSDSFPDEVPSHGRSTSGGQRRRDRREGGGARGQRGRAPYDLPIEGLFAGRARRCRPAGGGVLGQQGGPARVSGRKNIAWSSAGSPAA